MKLYSPLLVSIFLYPSHGDQLVGTDIPLDGACAAAISSLCPSSSYGNGRVALCLKKHKKTDASAFDDGCIAELNNFLVAASEDVKNKDFDIQSKCIAELSEGNVCGGVTGKKEIKCLREHTIGNDLSADCKSAVRAHQINSARNVDLDPMLHEFCHEEITDLTNIVGKDCANKPPAEKYGCLKSHRDNLSEKCQSKLFLKEKDAAGDLRADPMLAEQCAQEINTFCGEKAVGRGAVLPCLYKHKKEINFSEQCRAQIMKKEVDVSTDYRLNFLIMTECKDDINSICADTAEAVAQSDKPRFSGKVLKCLKDNFRVTNDKCKAAIINVVRPQSSNAVLNAPLLKVCRNDAMNQCCANEEWCNNVENGAKIMKCLKKNYDSLADDCKEEILDELEVESNSIEMKGTIVEQCAGLISGPCKDIEASDGKMIDCLTDHKDDAENTAECKSEIELDLELTAKDYRLKFGITNDCSDDMTNLCADKLLDVNSQSKTHGGAVLWCLMENKDKVENQLCKEDISRYVRTVAMNWKADERLKSVCAYDVNLFCNGVEAGHGKVNECLMENIQEKNGVSQECVEAEFNLKKDELTDIKVNPLLQRACRNEITAFCSSSADEEGSVIACLEDSVEKEGFGTACRAKVQKEVVISNLDYRLNPKLVHNCKQDVDKFCSEQKNGNKKFGHQVLDCLIEHREDLVSGCKAALMRNEIQRASDYRVDPNVSNFCVNDVVKFCKDVTPGEGRVHDCLGDSLEDLELQCRKAEFAEQVMKEDSIRLNPLMKKKCGEDVNRFCSGVSDGNVMTCLQKKVGDPDMTLPCKQVVQRENAKQGKSLAFNKVLKKACADTLAKFSSGNNKKTNCFVKKGFLFKTDGTGADLPGSGIECLTTHLADIEDQNCADAVRKKVEMQSKNIMNTAGLFNHCADDTKELCSGVKPGGGLLLNCLMENFASVKSSKCKESVNTLKTNQKIKVVMNPVVAEHCSNESNMFCKGLSPSALGKCLTQNSMKEGFSLTCKRTIELYGFEKSLSDPGPTITAASSNGDGGGIVIRGPLAAISMMSLFGVLFGICMCGKKRHDVSKHNYKVVMRDDPSHML